MDQDRRQDERSSTSIEAAVQINGSQHPCRLKNISASGAQVALDLMIDEGMVLALVIPPYAPINGKVMWHKAKAIGIKFNDDTESIEDVLLGLSARASAY